MIYFQKPTTAKETFMRINSAIALNNTDSDGMIKKESGVYIIYKNDICLYIGQSNNLASRITTHLHGKYESSDVIFYMKKSLFGREFSLIDIEDGLIQLLSPIENVLVKSDKNNSRVIEELISLNIDFGCIFSNSNSSHDGSYLISTHGEISEIFEGRLELFHDEKLNKLIEKPFAESKYYLPFGFEYELNDYCTLLMADMYSEDSTDCRYEKKKLFSLFDGSVPYYKNSEVK